MCACVPCCWQLEVTKLEQLEKAQDELRLRALLWNSLDEWDTFLSQTLAVREPIYQFFFCNFYPDSMIQSWNQSWMWCRDSVGGLQAPFGELDAVL